MCYNYGISLILKNTDVYVYAYINLIFIAKRRSQSCCRSNVHAYCWICERNVLVG